MPDLTIKIEDGETPAEEIAAAEAVAEEINEVSEDDEEIDEKWLTSKFDAIEECVNRTQAEILTIKEMLPSNLVSLIQEMAERIANLSTRLMETAEKAAEIKEESLSTPQESAEVEVIAPIINPEENADAPPEAEENLPPKRKRRAI